MDYTGKYIINGKDCWTEWNMVFLAGTYMQVLSGIKRKEQYSYSWLDEDGTDRVTDNPTFESRNLSLPVAILTSVDIASKALVTEDGYVLVTDTGDQLTTSSRNVEELLHDFISYAGVLGYFPFDVIGLNRRLTLLYDSISDLKIYGMGAASFTLNLIDDSPTTIQTVP